ncbi:MAG TPA: ribonuclease PH [Actinomycetota bacterium]|nr:ribonuclease PH [Actinomycetota bacterium]
MDPLVRADGRGTADLRPLKAEMDYLDWAEGSVLLEVGKTRVLASASYESRPPRFLQGTGSGWVTAEYAMLPRSTAMRTPREVQAGRPSGRTQEIQRLVGRSLRSVTALERMGECTIWIDCDILQADGGTRTASITAGYLALAQAIGRLSEAGTLPADLLHDTVAAVSVGIVDGELLLDLAYDEDAKADVDFNVVMTGSAQLVEVQGTAEGKVFSRQELDALIDLAASGIEQLTDFQHQILSG